MLLCCNVNKMLEVASSGAISLALCCSLETHPVLRYRACGFTGTENSTRWTWTSVTHTPTGKMPSQGFLPRSVLGGGGKEGNNVPPKVKYTHKCWRPDFGENDRGRSTGDLHDVWLYIGFPM